MIRVERGNSMAKSSHQCGVGSGEALNMLETAVNQKQSRHGGVAS